MTFTTSNLVLGVIPWTIILYSAHRVAWYDLASLFRRRQVCVDAWARVGLGHSKLWPDAKVHSAFPFFVQSRGAFRLINRNSRFEVRLDQDGVTAIKNHRQATCASSTMVAQLKRRLGAVARKWPILWRIKASFNNFFIRGGFLRGGLMKSVNVKRERPSQFLNHLSFFLVWYLLLDPIQGLMLYAYTEIKVCFSSNMSSLNGD